MSDPLVLFACSVNVYRDCIVLRVSDRNERVTNNFTVYDKLDMRAYLFRMCIQTQLLGVIAVHFILT